MKQLGHMLLAACLSLRVQLTRAMVAAEGRKMGIFCIGQTYHTLSYMMAGAIFAEYGATA